jgi:hypothetical protein
MIKGKANIISVQNISSEQEILSRKYYANDMNVPKILCNINFKTVVANIIISQLHRRFGQNQIT